METVGKLMSISPRSLDAYGTVPSMPSSFRYCQSSARVRNEMIPRTLLTAMPVYAAVDDFDKKIHSFASSGGGSQSSVFARQRIAVPRALSRRVDTLIDLGHAGTYLDVAAFLSPTALVQLDAACTLLREMNRAFAGPWFAHGVDQFRGLELTDEGIFHSGEDLAVPRARLLQEDWKQRVTHFGSEVQCFQMPFDGFEINEVKEPDEIAYCRCHLRTDLLSIRHADDVGGKVYIEFEISRNPDNVSLALVDFEAGGCSSVTFSPDTGAVIRERKVNETPRKVEGAYIQPLNTITAGQCFQGFIGLYYSAGHLAFFRRHSYSVAVHASDGSETLSSDRADVAEAQLGPWETTGFVTDISWAEGCRLTPCLAFRNEGAYNVRLVRRGMRPPFMPDRNTAAYTDGWNSLDWDATEHDELEG